MNRQFACTLDVTQCRIFNIRSTMAFVVSSGSDLNEHQREEFTLQQSPLCHASSIHKLPVLCHEITEETAIVDRISTCSKSSKVDFQNALCFSDTVG